MSVFEGKTAFIFVGDGEYAGNDPAAAAARQKNRYGDNLCIYPVLVGSEEYNMKLGERRAEAAKQFLINQGVPAERLSTESFGYSRPTATNSTDWGRARNRRDEFKWSRQPYTRYGFRDIIKGSGKFDCPTFFIWNRNPKPETSIEYVTFSK